MKGKIVQFRRGRHRIHERHFLIELGLSKKEALGFIGKEVVWKSSSGKIIRGKISNVHGNKGLVRAIFERGLPGQAVMNNDEVSILGGENEKIKSTSQSANMEVK